MKSVLGLDIGNAKLKVCLTRYTGSQIHAVYWDSIPLAFGTNRRHDFATSLPFRLLNFLDEQQQALESLEGTVVCCSHSLSYEPFSESVYHLGQILTELFEESPIWLLRADGHLTPAAKIALIGTRETYGYTFTNFYGSAFLASKRIQNGISLDLGTTTLDVIPIVEGQIDPIGLQRPQDYLRFRYAHQRIHWLGLTHAPLASLTEAVNLGQERYQIVPRHYRTELLMALHHASNPDLLKRHAYGHHFPSAKQAQAELAQFIGLDHSLLSEDDLQELFQFLWQTWQNRISQAILAVVDTFKKEPHELQWAIFALGAEALLRPLLEKWNVPAIQIHGLEIGKEQALWSASSAFAMTLLAAEALGDHLEWQTP